MTEQEQIPEAVMISRRNRLPQLVWILPLIAALISGWLLVDTMAKRGPTITISFLTAEGIEAGKTRLRHKNVDIGEVKASNSPRIVLEYWLLHNSPKKQKNSSRKIRDFGWCAHA